jgi:hypothetical protein
MRARSDRPRIYPTASGESSSGSAPCTGIRSARHHGEWEPVAPRLLRSDGGRATPKSILRRLGYRATVQCLNSTLSLERTKDAAIRKDGYVSEGIACYVGSSSTTEMSMPL